jgi:hypothetical protein
VPAINEKIQSYWEIPDWEPQGAFLLAQARGSPLATVDQIQSPEQDWTAQDWMKPRQDPKNQV